MPTLDEKMSLMAELVLKRQLSEEEKNEIFRISDAMGMANVQSFLHIRALGFGVKVKFFAIVFHS
jgi:hypothetical protein